MLNAKINRKEASGKNLFQITLVAVAVALSSCSSTSPVSSGKSYDDVYGSSSANNNTVSQPQHSAPSDYTSAAPQYNPNETNGNSQNSESRFDYGNTNENPSATSGSSDGQGNTYVTNNYYNNDDYYDYAYSARIRRFYHPYGWGYYDSYYTNSYMYDYNPYSWNMSIYLGYSWWAPASYYYSPFTWGISIGYGYPYYGYGAYYPSYYGYGGGCGGCGSCGGCGGCGGGGYNSCSNSNPYYYNSYDYACTGNNVYYGPHRSTTGSNHQSIAPKSVSQLYEANVLKSVKGSGTSLNANASGTNYSSVPRPKNILNASDSYDGSTSGGEIKSNPKNNSLVKPGNTNTADMKNDDAGNYNSNPRPKNGNYSNPKSTTQSKPRPANNVNGSNSSSDPRPKINDTFNPKNNSQSPPRPKNDLNNDQSENNYEQPVKSKDEYNKTTPKSNSTSEPRPAKKHWWVPKSMEKNSTNSPSYSQPKGHDSYSAPKQNTPAPSYSQPKPQQSQPHNDNSGSGSRRR